MRTGNRKSFCNMTISIEVPNKDNQCHNLTTCKEITWSNMSSSKTWKKSKFLVSSTNIRLAVKSVPLSSQNYFLTIVPKKETITPFFFSPRKSDHHRSLNQYAKDFYYWTQTRCELPRKNSYSEYDR